MLAAPASYPGITVDVADVLSEPCIERVTTMRADSRWRPFAQTPELQAEVFCADDFHLVCRADHPLAGAAAIKLRDLAAWPFIHLSRSSSVRQHLEAAFHPQAMDTVMEVDQLATVMGMVRAGLGISVVPALALFHFQKPESRPGRFAARVTRRIFSCARATAASRSRRRRCTTSSSRTGRRRRPWRSAPLRRGAVVASGRKLMYPCPGDSDVRPPPDLAAHRGMLLPNRASTSPQRIASPSCTSSRKGSTTT